MRTIGMIGGLSWESSAVYYRLINEEARRRLGGLRSARSLMFSFDFGEVEALQAEGRWDEAGRLMEEAGRSLARGGADFLLICSNTMHRMADAVENASGIPLLHIADPTAEALRRQGFTRVGLLGTAFTMEQDFYKGRLRDRWGIEALVPGASARAEIHRVIFEELVRGRIEESSRAAFRDIIAGLADDGAQAVILGCTEIILLVRPEDSPLPVYDTTTLHALAAVERALA